MVKFKSLKKFYNSKFAKLNFRDNEDYSITMSFKGSKLRKTLPEKEFKNKIECLNFIKELHFKVSKEFKQNELRNLKIHLNKCKVIFSNFYDNCPNNTIKKSSKYQKFMEIREDFENLVEKTQKFINK